MKPDADILVIINPASAAGRTLRRIPQLTEAFRRRFASRCQFSITRRPGDASAAACEARRLGIPLIVAVGGDGTLNEVVNGMLVGQVRPAAPCTLGIVNSGSGGGFALSLGIPRELEDQVDLIADCPPRAVDVGALSASGGEGSARGRLFLNECQIGIGADVVRYTRRTQKSAGGLLAYGLGTFTSLFRSPNAVLSVCVDGEWEPPQSVLGLAIGNGGLTAGGMALTPGAEPDDGLLNLLTIRGLGLGGRLRSFPRIYTGEHVHSPGFGYRRFSWCRVCGPRSIPIAADGEMIGSLPCEISVRPHALTVLAPPPTREHTDECRPRHAA